MQQYNFKNGILNLKVKRSPLLVRVTMFFFAFFFFAFPVLGVLLDMMTGSRLQFGYFVAIGILALLGFYLLRVSLWNTYGEENIEILYYKITYEANYGWFKDGKKEFDILAPNYTFKTVGYEEDYMGVLVISSEKPQFESVVKMPLAQLEELIFILNRYYFINDEIL